MSADLKVGKILDTPAALIPPRRLLKFCHQFSEGGIVRILAGEMLKASEYFPVQHAAKLFP